ncbi:uncharacterized membrane protein YkvA (DUF1232 family) [Desmospora activa DSM 45169]|uniref:Uncharacterized membrane protein YkvA (DUF1232 family) n=1 Tax=Desmospora activa DSM 45169 TaxID=1121389 RepID=A0A2T4ZCU1_9BACL|nr:uncharacterized membrane protein YkvA (DUF1232 family) [Desmospora activa DSM 45169]
MTGLDRKAKRVGGIAQVAKKWKALYRYFRDPKTSWVKKALAVAALLYFIMPMDIIPDYLVVMGYLDDLTLAAFVWRALSKELEHFSSEE